MHLQQSEEFDYLIRDLRNAHKKNDLEALSDLRVCPFPRSFYLGFEEKHAELFDLLLNISLDLLRSPLVFKSNKLWDSRMKTDLPLEALKMAISARRPGAGLIHHSDRGVQYASSLYQELLAKEGIVCSMSRKGNCWDNSVAESFFSTIKREMIYPMGI